MEAVCFQVPTTMDAFMLYGPVVPDGYGACYNPHADYIVICVSSFKSWNGTDSSRFASMLTESLLDMKQLCLLSNTSTQNGGVSSVSREHTVKT
jgi:choline O-acetyltransferase